jgi:hypothetical protein
MLGRLPYGVRMNGRATKLEVTIAAAKEASWADLQAVLDTHEEVSHPTPRRVVMRIDL